jgi:predicted ester cyclase
MKSANPLNFQSMENKTVISRYINEIGNTGRVEEIEKFISPEYVEVHEGVVHKIGIEGARDHVLGVRHVYPDLNIRIDRQIEEGEWVATSITVTGTFEKEWLGMKPTGKKVTYTGVNINRVVDGLIVEHGGAANLMGPLLQAEVLKVV